MDETLARTLDRLKVGDSISQGPLHVFPLCTGGFVKEDLFLLLEDGLEVGTLHVRELSEGGSVPELRVANEGTLPVLISPRRSGSGS